MRSYGLLVAPIVLLLSGCGGGSSTTQPPSDNQPDTNGNGNTGNNNPAALKVYVAGESIEEYNHMNTLPFNADGTLNGTTNTAEEVGWMVPFAQRLHIRDSSLSVEWVGSGCWSNPDTSDCSTGTYTNNTIGFTSAIAGTTVEDWINLHGSELTDKTYCYDIAFAARGGNDLNGEIDLAFYKTKLKELVLALDQGSSCRTHPIVYVTAHMLDAAAMGSLPANQTDVNNWLNHQKAYYVDIAQEVVDELNTNGRKVRLIDMWTPFYSNTATVAFPNAEWWTTSSGVHRPDLAKIHREDLEVEAHHPRRLSSIYAGECVADQVNLDEVKSIE
jgi:hypothetical protein